MATSLPTRSPAEWVDDTACELHDFAEQVTPRTDLADYPHAAAVRDNVLVYESAPMSGPIWPVGSCAPN